MAATVYESRPITHHRQPHHYAPPSARHHVAPPIPEPPKASTSQEKFVPPEPPLRIVDAESGNVYMRVGFLGEVSCIHPVVLSSVKGESRISVQRVICLGWMKRLKKVPDHRADLPECTRYKTQLEKGERSRWFIKQASARGKTRRK